MATRPESGCDDSTRNGGGGHAVGRVGDARARRRSRLAAAVILAAGVTQGTALAQETAPAPDAKEAKAVAPTRPWLRGSIHSRYWLRWTGDDSDQDLYETLTLEFGDAEHDRITGYFMGRGAWDMDGTDPSSSVFFSLDDRRGDNLSGHVYDAYIDVHRVAGLGLVRAGRQPIQDTPEFAFFDGLRLESVELGDARLQFGVYGGLSAHLYESSTEGDWTVGGYAQARPWAGGRARLDWMHLEDDQRLGDHEDDLYGAGLWQQIGDDLRLEGHYSRVEGRDRDVRGTASWTLPTADLSVTATYYQLLRAQRSLVLELDPLYSTLRDYFPFWQATAAVTKGITEHLLVTVGGDLRRVRDSSDEGTFNRDYERYFATAGLSDLWIDGLSVEATADLWRSGSQDVSSWGVDLGQESADRAWRLSAGTYYSLYKYDLFFNRENDDVRTWYVRLRNKVSSGLNTSVTWEYEDSDLDRFYFLRAEATWRF